MPQAVQADWNLIRDLYSKGMTATEIAKETGVQSGTIASRASRGQWKAVATKANSIVQVEIRQPKESSDDGQSGELAKASTAARTALSDEVLRAVATLGDTKPSKRLESQRERAGVVQTLASAAKTVFGWSEGQSAPAVRINIMGSAVIQEQKPVIDVASTPVLPPPES